MKVLITGGLGYLGSSLISIIRNTEEISEVVVLDNQRTGRIEAFYKINDERFSFVDGDISDIYDLDYALEGVDCVIHLAALVNTPLGVYDGSALYKNNIIGTEVLMEKARSAGVKKIIFASSLSVYGPVDNEGNTDFGLSPYPKSKLTAEKIIEEASNASGIEFWILRLGILFGKAPVGHFDSFINSMVLQAALRRKVTVFGAGNQKRGIIAVSEAASAILDCLRNKVSPGVYDAFSTIASPMDVVTILQSLDPHITVNLTDQDVRVRYDIFPQGETRIVRQDLLEQRVKDLFLDYTLFPNSL